MNAQTVTEAEGSQRVHRGIEVSTVDEAKSLINERELHNWCVRCRGFAMPIISNENSAGLCIGVAMGLAGAWWAGDFTNHGDRQFALYFGIAVFGLLAALFALRARSERKQTETDLSKLAVEMESACKAGLPPASALRTEQTGREPQTPAPQATG